MAADRSTLVVSSQSLNPHSANMKALRVIGKFCVASVERIGSGMAAITAVIILIMALIVTADVVMRYVFNQPILWGFEVVRYMVIATAYLPLAYIERLDKHLQLNLFYERMSQRWQGVVTITTYLAGLFLVGSLFVVGLDMATTSFQYGYKSETATPMPLGPSQLLIPIGASMLCLQFIIGLAGALCKLGNSHEPTTREVTNGSIKQ